MVKKREVMNEQLNRELRHAIGRAARQLPDFGVDTSRNNIPIFERSVIGQNHLGRHYLYETTENKGFGFFSIVTLDVIQETSAGEFAVRAAKIVDLDIVEVKGFGDNLSEDDKTRSAIELLMACISFDRTFTVSRGGVYRIP